jgi:hypothetical protein
MLSSVVFQKIENKSNELCVSTAEIFQKRFTTELKEFCGPGGVEGTGREDTVH